MSSSTDTASATFVAVEAFPTAPGKSAGALDVTALEQARRMARQCDEALLCELWRIHGARIVRAVLENPQTPDSLLSEVERLAVQDPLIQRQLAAVRACRNLRGTPATSLSRADARDAAYDTGRSANDLRVLHHLHGGGTVVAMTLVGNPAVPSDVLEKLVHHPAAMVRRAARHRQATQLTGVDVQRIVSRQRAVNL